MPTSTTDPVTGIVIPTPEQRSGPQYATDISNALLTLAHLTHTGAANSDGYQIPSAGINFNADLSAQSNNLTSLRTTRYTSQGSTIGGVGDLNCVYFVDGELYINDGTGQPVKITSDGAVNTTSNNNLSVKSITANHTINSSDGYAVIECNFTPPTANKIITLPLANAVPAGRFYYIKDAEGSAATVNITLTPAGSDTIDDDADLVMNNDYQAVLIMSDGSSNWMVYYFGGTDSLKGPAITITATSTTITATAATTINLTASTDINLDAANSFNITADNDGYVFATDDLTVKAQDALLLSGVSVTLAGGLYLPTKAVTSSPYTVDTTTKDVIIYVDPNGAPVTINLPAAVNGRVLWIQDVGGTANTYNITLVRSGGDTIQGLSADYVMDADYQGIMLAAYSGGSWFIVG